MNISKGSKWYKVFMWSLGICESFTGKHLSYKYQNGTNLCHMMQTIFVYMPLIFLSQLLVLGAAFSVLIYVPFKWFGALTWLGLILVIAVGIFLLVSFFVGGDKLKNKIERWYDEKEPSLVWEWIKAKKHKICPLIKWESGHE